MNSHTTATKNMLAIAHHNLGKGDIVTLHGGEVRHRYAGLIVDLGDEDTARAQLAENGFACVYDGLFGSTWEVQP